MIQLDLYLPKFLEEMRRLFGPRFLYMGLQGSYLRGEADEHSDLDIMVVLEELTVADLACYRRLVEEMGDSDKACGFICGRADLSHWNPCEICHLLHTTKDYWGVLAQLTPSYTAEDERNYLKISLNNLYHALCHSFVHACWEDNLAQLPSLYKGVFFILQNLHFLRTGDFFATKKELLARLPEDDRRVLAQAMRLKNQPEYDFDEAFSLLFNWCQNTMQTL